MLFVDLFLFRTKQPNENQLKPGATAKIERFLSTFKRLFYSAIQMY